MHKRDRIQELLEEIKTRRDELFVEYEKLKVKYNFDYKEGKIKFTEAAKKYQKEFRFPL
jgi:hypothetical protein